MKILHPKGFPFKKPRPWRETGSEDEAAVALSQTAEQIKFVSDQNQPHQKQQNTGDNIDIF